VTRSVGPKEAALRKARESKAGGKKAEEGDPEDRAEEAHGKKTAPRRRAIPIHGGVLGTCPVGPHADAGG